MDSHELISALPPHSFPTFGNLAQWYKLGGKCGRCGHHGWVDRWALQQRYGKDKYIIQLQGALRCTKCGAKGSNTWVTGREKR